MTVRAKARVQVTLEVAVQSGWDGSCSLDQIFKQAKEEAVSIVRQLLKSDSKVAKFDIAKVVAISTEEE